MNKASGTLIPGQPLPYPYLTLTQHRLPSVVGEVIAQSHETPEEFFGGVPLSLSLPLPLSCYLALVMEIQSCVSGVDKVMFVVSYDIFT